MARQSNQGGTPWPPGRAQKPYPISKEALLFQMDLAGVQRAVLVPPSWEGDRNDIALDAARTYPDRFAVMGRLALQDPASRGKLDEWTKQPGLLGIRLTFHNEHYRPFLTDGTADWLWLAAERAGIPLMVLMPSALDHLDRIASTHPGLKLVIDHVGLDVRGKGPRVFEELPAVCKLAKHPNVAVKASGMPSLSTECYPFRDLHPHSGCSLMPSAHSAPSGARTSHVCPARNTLQLFKQRRRGSPSKQGLTYQRHITDVVFASVGSAHGRSSFSLGQGRRCTLGSRRVSDLCPKPFGMNFQRRWGASIG